MKKEIPNLQVDDSIKGNWSNELVKNVVIAFITKNMDYKNIDSLLLDKPYYRVMGYKSKDILNSIGLTLQFKGLFYGYSKEQLISSLIAERKNKYSSLVNILKYREKSTNLEKKASYSLVNKSYKKLESISQIGKSERELLNLFGKFKDRKLSLLINELNENNKFEEVSLRRILEETYPNNIKDGYCVDTIKLKDINSINKNGDSKEVNQNTKAEKEIHSIINLLKGKETKLESTLTKIRKRKSNNVDKTNDDLFIKIQELTGYSRVEITNLMVELNGFNLDLVIEAINKNYKVPNNKLKLLFIKAFKNNFVNGYIAMDTKMRRNITKSMLEEASKQKLTQVESNVSKKIQGFKINKETKTKVNQDSTFSNNFIKTNRKQYSKLKTKEKQVIPYKHIEHVDNHFKKISNTVPTSLEYIPNIKEILDEFIAEIFNNKILLVYSETLLMVKKEYGDSMHLSMEILNRHGYKKMGNYIIQEKYKSPEQAIRSYIKNNNIINIEQNPYSKLDIFREIIIKLEKNREIYEIKKNQYISDDTLYKAGINKRVINDFIKQIEEYKEDEYVFFTIYSLLNSDFKHPLLDLGFDNFFYEKLIRKSTRVLQWIVGKEIIFYKILPKKKLLLGDFFLWHIEKNGSIDYQDLLRFLHNKYGIEYSHHVVKNNVEKKGAYYSDETEKYYLNKEIYYREVYF